MTIDTLTAIDASKYDGKADLTRGGSKDGEDLASKLNAQITKINEVIAKLNLIPDEIQSGTETVAAAADKAVTFPVEFTGVPEVVAVVDTTGQTVTFIDDLATTGCTINFSAAYTGDVMWIAVYSA